MHSAWRIPALILAVAPVALEAQADSARKDVETLYRISYVKLESLSQEEIKAVRKLEADPGALRDKLVKLNRAFARAQQKEINQRESAARIAEIKAKAHPEDPGLKKKAEDMKAAAINGNEGFVIHQQVSETSAKALSRWHVGVKAEQLLDPGELDFIDPPRRRSKK